MDLLEHKKKLTESLKLLSLTFEEQSQCFQDFVDVPFEVIDDYGNAFLLLPPLIEADFFNYATIANLVRLHNLINFTANRPEFKDLEEDQFANSEEWNIVRRLSRETLQLMGEPIEKPDLKYI